MRELKSNLWLTMAGLAIAAVVIIAGVMILSKPSLSYKSGMQKSLRDLSNKDALFYPWQLSDVIDGKTPGVVLFDIRNDYDFSHGHIPGAENIQAADLSEKSFIRKLDKLKKKNMTVVLYGNDQLQANGPWMLFRQVGFDNVKVLAGGYRYYVLHKDDLAATKSDSSYIEGVPRYNFAEMAAPHKGSVSNTSAEKKPVEIQRRKKTSAVSGGC